MANTWEWKEYDDGSGGLRKPDGSSFFSYDKATKEYIFASDAEPGFFNDGNWRYYGDREHFNLKEFAENAAVNDSINKAFEVSKNIIEIYPPTNKFPYPLYTKEEKCQHISKALDEIINAIDINGVKPEEIEALVRGKDAAEHGEKALYFIRPDAEQIQAGLDWDWELGDVIKGYTIGENGECSKGELSVIKIDDMQLFDSDAEAAEQAKEDGVKLIPKKELSFGRGNDMRNYRYIDTPKNRKLLSRYISTGKKLNVEKDYIHSEEFISKFGDWEKANRLEKLKNAEPLVHNNDIIMNNENVSQKVEELRKNNDVASLRKVGEQIGKFVFQDLRKQQNLLGEKDKVLIHNNDRNLEVIFPMSGIRETKEHNATTKGHIEAIAYIPEIIKNGIYIASEKNEDNRRPHIEHFEYFATGIKLHDEDFTCKSVFGVTKSGDVYYDQNLSEIEKGRLVDIMLEKNKVLQRVPSNRKGEAGLDSLKAFNLVNTKDSFELSENKSPSAYYDKRLINICQVPQMPYLEMVNGKWQPKKEAVQAVKDGKLYVEKIGQDYQMRDSLNLAEKLAPEKQYLTLGSFMQDVEAQCGNDKSVKNILIQSANLIKNLDESSKKLLREEFSKAEIKGQDSLVDFLDKKINPKKEMKRKVSKNRDSDFERTR